MRSIIHPVQAKSHCVVGRRRMLQRRDKDPRQYGQSELAHCFPPDKEPCPERAEAVGPQHPPTPRTTGSWQTTEPDRLTICDTVWSMRVTCAAGGRQKPDA